MTAELRCCGATSYPWPWKNGSYSLRAPLVPETAGVLNVDQSSCEALNGAVGPMPPLMGLNAVPLPLGMAKQLVQPVPEVTFGAGVEIGSGVEKPSGVLLSNPHGL